MREPKPQTRVTPREYCDLLLSRRLLERLDDSTTGLRRLRDRTTGELYVIEERELFAHDEPIAGEAVG